MNNITYVAVIKWKKIEDGKKRIIPIKDRNYFFQISVEGKYRVNGSSWSVFCYNDEMLGVNKTKSYIKYLNQNDAPDNLKSGIKFDLYEMNYIVASGIIVDKLGTFKTKDEYVNFLKD